MAGLPVVSGARGASTDEDPANPLRTVTVPVHAGRDLKPGTLRAIIRQTGFTVEEFTDLL
jgi:HicA toxin of bacterial toxin-antitoxin,